MIFRALYGVNGMRFRIAPLRVQEFDKLRQIKNFTLKQIYWLKVAIVKAEKTFSVAKITQELMETLILESCIMFDKIQSAIKIFAQVSIIIE